MWAETVDPKAIVYRRHRLDGESDASRDSARMGLSHCQHREGLDLQELGDVPVPVVHSVQFTTPFRDTREPSVEVAVAGSSWFRLGCCDGDGMFGFARRSSVPYTRRAGMNVPAAGVRFG